MADLKVDGLVLEQGGRELLLLRMRSNELQRVCYVTPRSKDDPNEVQRILKGRRAADIAEYIDKPGTLLPTAVVVALDEHVEVLPQADPMKRTVVFPGGAGKHAYVLDGQHRLAGFLQSKAQFDLPVVAIAGLDETTRARIFADINSKQERITDVHILALYYQVKALDPDDMELMHIVAMLNEDADSPLNGRVKVIDGQKDTWIKNSILKRFLAPVLPELAGRGTAAEKAHVIKEYLKAARALWQAEWTSKDHVLTGPFGLEILFSIFGAVLYRVDLNRGRSTTTGDFKSQMECLTGITLKLDLAGTEIDVPVDFSKDLTRAFAGQKGRTRLTRELVAVLKRADRAAT